MLEGQRVLFLSPFPAWPLYGGAVVRNHHLIGALARRNLLWVASRGPARPEPLPPVQDWWSSPTDSRWQLFNPLWLHQLAGNIRKQRIQVLFASSLLIGPQAACLSHLTGVPLLLDAHNAETARMRRDGSRAWPLMHLLESLTVRSARRLTCVSREDAEHLRQLGARQIQVVPNGCSPPDDLPPLSFLPGKKVVLFFGVLHYGANRQAVETILSRLAPALPDAQFVIAGMGGEQWSSRTIPPNVNFLGYVENLSSLLKGVDLTIVPVESGGGTRLKILESVAHGRPVVSSVIGAEGLERDCFGAYLQIAADPVEFTQRVEELLVHPLQQEVPDAFGQRYFWDSLLAGGWEW
jgi:glycosyltransferase involved in cell wall biosynthesis